MEEEAITIIEEVSSSISLFVPSNIYLSTIVHERDILWQAIGLVIEDVIIIDIP